MRSLLLCALFFLLPCIGEAQPFIGKTELYIKSNVQQKSIYGIDAANGERQLSISDDSSKFEYYFSGADHLCYKSMHIPQREHLLQQAIAANNEDYLVIKLGKEWLFEKDGIKVKATLEYSKAHNQFVLIYRTRE